MRGCKRARPGTSSVRVYGGTDVPRAPQDGMPRTRVQAVPFLKPISWTFMTVPLVHSPLLKSMGDCPITRKDV